MTSKFSVIGDSTKITFEWTALTSKIQSIVGDCAEYLFNHGYGVDGKVFSDLTNAQKLELVETHLKDVIISASNTFKSIKAQEIAREAEEAVKYEL
jgi:hypothetical protein